jgi:4-hydroxythreonine-4-phosphate dehydrogenase
MATARPAPRLVVTTGDPCGVGPELLVAALGSTRGAVAATVLGRTSLLDAACGCLERAGPLSAALAARFRARLGSRVRVVETTAPPHWSRPGHWDERNVEYLRESLDRSIELAASTGSGLVTGPCDKRFFAALGMSGAGHTEYLALRLGGREPLMLFDSPRLRVALLTRHVPLHAVTGLATRERLAAAVARHSH